MRRRWRIILLALAAIVLLAASVGAIWLQPAAPLPQAVTALQSDSVVSVDSTSWLLFRPAASQPTTGFIFYPGGLVDPRAYAPAAHDIAAQGYLVVIVPMPLNLAFFDANRASDVMSAQPQIRTWAIGGHSLGGVAAAMFVQSHPNALQGLVFWASYPAGDMSSVRVRVLSISGTRDGLATPAKIAASREQLPAGAQWIAIEGGNHGQFGWYGNQSDDGEASISREEQQRQVVSATVSFLQTLP